MPEEVRKVYVSVAKNIPMFDSEKLRIIQKYPECFTKVESKSYGDKVRRLMNLKEKARSVKEGSRKSGSRQEQLSAIKKKGFGTRIYDLQFIPTDEVEFPDPKLPAWVEQAETLINLITINQTQNEKI